MALQYESDDDIPLSILIKSVQEEEQRQILVNEHETRLKSIISCNNYTLGKITEDGNCLFASVCTYYRNITHSQLRKISCEH